MRAQARACRGALYRTPGAVWAHISNIQIITKFNLTRDAPLVGGTVGKIDIFSNLVLRVLAHCNRERSSIQGHWYQFYHYRTTFTHPMPLHSS